MWTKPQFLGHFYCDPSKFRLKNTDFQTAHFQEYHLDSSSIGNLEKRELIGLKMLVCELICIFLCVKPTCLGHFFKLSFCGPFIYKIVICLLNMLLKPQFL